MYTPLVTYKQMTNLFCPELQLQQIFLAYNISHCDKAPTIPFMHWDRSKGAWKGSQSQDQSSAGVMG